MGDYDFTIELSFRHHNKHWYADVENSDFGLSRSLFDMDLDTLLKAVEEVISDMRDEIEYEIEQYNSRNPPKSTESEA